MIKINTQATVIQISLILSILLFVNVAQSISDMNLQLDNNTHQSKLKVSLNLNKSKITQYISQLEQQREQFVTQQIPKLQQDMQVLQKTYQVIMDINQIIPRLPTKNYMDQLIIDLQMLPVQSDQLHNIQQYIAVLELQNQQLRQNIQILLSLHHDLDQALPHQLLNQLMQQQSNRINRAMLKLYQGFNQLKRQLQAIIVDLDQVSQINTQITEAADIQPNIQIFLIQRIQQVQQDVQKFNTTMQIIPLPITFQEQLQLVQIFRQARQKIQQETDYLNQRITALNQEIITANQKVFAINQQLDDLDNVEHTHYSQQKVLHKAIQNHNTAVINAVNITASTTVSAITATLSKIQMKQEHSYNIMSSRLNIDSNNNCWNIQGNVFTIPSRQEKNEEIEEHEGVINGAFLTVNRYLNEKTIIGVTGLYSNHNIQYNKNIKYIFDKIDCKIFSLSLNGRYYPRQNVFTQGIISFIQYDGKTECILNQYHSEINGQSYYCDFMLGCTLYPVKHSTKLILSPAVGIICKNASHKFFDDTTVCDAKHYVLDSRVGAAIKYTIDNKKYTIDNKNILTIFELYTFIHSNLFTNRSDIKLEDFPSANSSAINIKPAKLPASLTQVGGAVTIWHSKIGFEVSYSAYLAEKYIAHVGAVSIKANF